MLVDLKKNSRGSRLSMKMKLQCSPYPSSNPIAFNSCTTAPHYPTPSQLDPSTLCCEKVLNTHASSTDATIGASAIRV
jgi:hypothetical protein